MKTLITIIFAALLTACGSGTIETTETIVKSEIVTPEPLKVEAPMVVTPEPATVKPEPEACDLTTYNPCPIQQTPTPTAPVCNPKDAGCLVPDGMEYCDMWSFAPCPYPMWIQKP